MFPFKLSLNSSTLFPYRLDVKEQVRIAAEAGYEGIELWVRDLDAYTANGGSMKELRRYIGDSGITVVNAIAFWKWADEDAAEREQGFLLAKKEMEMLAELGCIAAAAPPFGNVGDVPLEEVASQFAKLAELARSIGIEPYLEFWGRAKQLSRLSQAMYVAMESGVQAAKILLDPFHMYTGGSSLEGISYLNGDGIGIVHVNDYPALPARDVITDRDRVFPGDGEMPSKRFAQLLNEAGYRGYVSLELFIENFGEESALDVARKGLNKIKQAYSL